MDLITITTRPLNAVEQKEFVATAELPMANIAKNVNVSWVYNGHMAMVVTVNFRNQKDATVFALKWT